MDNNEKGQHAQTESTEYLAAYKQIMESESPIEDSFLRLSVDQPENFDELSSEQKLFWLDSQRLSLIGMLANCHGRDFHHGMLVEAGVLTSLLWMAREVTEGAILFEKARDQLGV